MFGAGARERARSGPGGGPGAGQEEADGPVTGVRVRRTGCEPREDNHNRDVWYEAGRIGEVASGTETWFIPSVRDDRKRT